jgi:hypothetical protein
MDALAEGLVLRTPSQCKRRTTLQAVVKHFNFYHFTVVAAAAAAMPAVTQLSLHPVSISQPQMVSRFLTFPYYFSVTPSSFCLASSSNDPSNLQCFTVRRCPNFRQQMSLSLSPATYTFELFTFLNCLVYRPLGSTPTRRNGGFYLQCSPAVALRDVHFYTNQFRGVVTTLPLISLTVWCL